MTNVRTIVIESVAELRALAPAWDQLWLRSATANPTNQAEHLALWLEQFAGSASVRAVVVEDQGKLLAALPLINQRWLRVFPVAAQLANPWAPQGELLLDPECDQSEVLQQLLQSTARLGWPLLWLNDVAIDAGHWQMLLAAAAKLRMHAHVQPRMEIGTIEIDQDWSAYRQRWGKNHRRNMKRALERADDLGGVQLRVITQPPSDELPALLRRVFALEDQGWKGAGGSSILQSPGMLEFYVRQAQQLIRQNEFCLVLLEQQERLIAFEYAWLAKGCYFPLKVAYDETNAELAPGQLLRSLLFEQFYLGGSVHQVDFTGPLVEATAKWSTSKYRIGRLAIALHPIGGAALLNGFLAARRLKRKLARTRGTPDFCEVELGTRAKPSPPVVPLQPASSL